MNLFRFAARLKRQGNAGETRPNSESRGRIEPEAASPLTGRETEISLLKDRWEQAQEGMGQVVLVIGEPGLGKSRLVQTLMRRVQAQGGEASSTATAKSASPSANQAFTIIEWRCSQHFQNSELHPVSDYLERFLGFGRDSSATSR